MPNLIMEIHSELFCLSVCEGSLRYRRELIEAGPNILKEVWAAAEYDNRDITTCIHSTSWRQTPQGLILTWVVAPDPRPINLANLPIVHKTPPRQEQLDAPGGDNIEINNVVLHAVEHLCYLAQRDEAKFAGARTTHPELWNLICTYDSARAGLLAAR